jgi:predicted DNA-binding ribbon-helix-helix protein|tara:strand:+ start:681 stop:854 length:174 start_codon:yes stop_codon:yes gene_type:complete
MNIEKYKSVAIHKETYDKIRTIAKEDYMSINNFIRKLVDKEHVKFRERKKEENGLAD